MRSRVFIPAMLLLAFLPGAFAQIQLIEDGSFESTTLTPPWQVTPPGSGAGITYGGGFLSMGNAFGATQNVYQTVTFPTNLIGATLSLYYETISTNPLGDDSLTISIQDINGNTLDALAYTYSAYPTSGYLNYTTNFITYPGSNTLSSYAGQTVNLNFAVVTDGTYGYATSFNITDVSLLAGTTANIPPNDDLADATPIPTAGITNDVLTTYASKEPGEPNHAGNRGGHSVWWTWTAPAIGTVSINTTGSSFDTVLAVYTNSAAGNLAFSNLTCVSSNNGGIFGVSYYGLASLKYNVSSGAQYYIALDGYNGQSGSAVFKFHFALDTNPPTVAFASPAAGAAVTNSSVLVKGTAKDNVAVAVVEYSLANAGGTNAWQVATTTNQWTNWFATVTNLIPGTNLVTMAAFDTSSNMSKLVSRVFDYDVPTPLTLSTNGRGAISGATNGQRLDLGFPYTLTAKAAAGFAFASWTGSFPTNNAKLTFLMASNLALIANFVDVTPPDITITSPKASQRWSNSTLTVTGSAKDNVAVAAVYCQLNGGVWTPASTGNPNAWTNWTATLTPLEKTNVLEAFSEDTSGNHSPTNKVLFPYIPSATLNVQTNGFGSITPVDNGKLLAIGTNYTLTASPGKNWVFSNWVASGSEAFVSNSSLLRFTMQSNLVLQANFVTNPFLAVAGVYNGLCYPTNGVTEAGSGFISATIASNSTGAYTAKLLLDGASSSFSGSFDLTGTAQTNLTRAGKTPVSVTLILDFNPADAVMGGSVSNAAAGWNSVIQADRAVFNATGNPAANYAGQFTLLLPPGANAPVGGPDGWGYAAITNTLGGISTLGGALADGTPFLWSVPVSQNGGVPLYQSLYSGKGSLLGWIYFTNQPPKSVAGISSVSWIKPAIANTLYPSGFTNLLTNMPGSFYTNTTKAGVPVLNLTGATLVLTNGGLTNGFLIYTNIGTNLGSHNTLTNLDAGNTNLSPTNHLAIAINTNNGLVTVTFQATGVKTNTIAHGAVLQNQTNAAGYFLGTNQSGAFLLGNP